MIILFRPVPLEAFIAIEHIDSCDGKPDRELLKEKPETVTGKEFSICLTIGTTVEEVQYILKHADQTPQYVRRIRDVVIWFGFMKHMTLDEVDGKLRDRGFRPLIRDL